MRLICLVAGFLATSAQLANAADGDAVVKCREEADSLRRLTCYDAIPITTARTRRKPQSDASLYMAEPGLRVQGKDYGRSIYNSRVEFGPSFKNNSDKTVIGITHHFEILDAFGDKIVSGDDNLDIRIEPRSAAIAPQFYMWEDNPFISGEPFDRLYSPVTNQTAKAMSVVKKVLYSDGTIEIFE